MPICQHCKRDRPRGVYVNGQWYGYDCLRQVRAMPAPADWADDEQDVMDAEYEILNDAPAGQLPIEREWDHMQREDSVKREAGLWNRLRLWRRLRRAG